MQKQIEAKLDPDADRRLTNEAQVLGITKEQLIEKVLKDFLRGTNNVDASMRGDMPKIGPKGRI